MAEAARAVAVARVLEQVVCREEEAAAPARFPVAALALRLPVAAGVRVAPVVCGIRVAEVPEQARVVQAAVEELGPWVESELGVQVKPAPQESGRRLLHCSAALVAAGGSALRLVVFRARPEVPAAVLPWKRMTCAPCSGFLRSSANPGKIPNLGWMCLHFSRG